MKPVLYVAEGDFFSLYPTIMVAHNISPETIIAGDSQENSIDMNFNLSGKLPVSIYEWYSPFSEIFYQQSYINKQIVRFKVQNSRLIYNLK